MRKSGSAWAARTDPTATNEPPPPRRKAGNAARRSRKADSRLTRRTSAQPSSLQALDRAVAERAPAHPDRVHDARERPEPFGLLDGALGAAGARDVDAVAVHGDHAVAVRLEPLDARAADPAGRPGHEDVHPGNLAQPQPNVRVATPRVW